MTMKSIASALAYSDTVIDREDDDDREDIESQDPPEFDEWTARRRMKRTA